MKAFDIVFKYERGEYKLFDATVVPTKDNIEELQETLNVLDLGKLEKVVIENIKWK